MTADGPRDTGDARAKRLAEALRENLRRRKAQARGRRDAGEEGKNSSEPQKSGADRPPP